MKMMHIYLEVFRNNKMFVFKFKLLKCVKHLTDKIPQPIHSISSLTII